MPHFYVKPENIKNNTFIMEDEQAHYLATVRRLNIGDEIMIFNGLGNSFNAKITIANKGYIEGTIFSSSYKMPVFEINICTAIPKGDRFEWLIEKAGELGITKIIPVNTKRSVSTAFSANKSERYEKISIAASSQCGRNDIMKIEEPIDFKKACLLVAEKKDFINVLPWESENNFSIKDLFNNKTMLGAKFRGANIFIGPEGGFENEEIEFAQNLGIKTITLGNNILRVETAAIVSAVLVLNLFGVYETK